MRAPRLDWLIVLSVVVGCLIAVLFGCVPAAPQGPKVTDGSGKLPSWVTEVWRDNVNGITCWYSEHGNATFGTCFRDRVECPAPQTEASP